MTSPEETPYEPIPHAVWPWLAGLAAAVLLAAAFTRPAAAHGIPDDGVPRTAVVSAFAPEMEILREELEGGDVHTVNGVAFTTGILEGREVVLFLSGISVVNAAMTVQLALDHFTIENIVFSGIAGGVDPSLNIGDVVIADRWGQYLETVFARDAGNGWITPPFFDYPHANFGMMFPRSVTVLRTGAAGPETRFWFPVDETLLHAAGNVAGNVRLADCTPDGTCLDGPPRVIVGGNGVSGSAFVDNADFRDHVFRTYEARVLDMESAAVAHVAYANDVPFIAVRSLSDLAGGGSGENRMETFLALAAANSSDVVRALLRDLYR